MADRVNGKVKFYDTTKGFGFITRDDGQKDVFVHSTALKDSGIGSLAEGQRISFVVMADKRGPKATDLRTA